MIRPQEHEDVETMKLFYTNLGIEIESGGKHLNIFKCLHFSIVT